MFKRKSKIDNVNAYVVSEEGNKLVIEFEGDKGEYFKGQRVVATVSIPKKTALGREALVADVIAQGIISDISGRRITICSKKNNPIISRKALMEAKKGSAVVNMKVLK